MMTTSIRRSPLFVLAFLMLTTASLYPADVRSAAPQDTPETCANEAPWHKPIPGDTRPYTAALTDLPDGVLQPKRPVDRIAGLWSVEFRGAQPELGMPTNARVVIYQQDEGYRCDPMCGYRAGTKDSLWMIQGERWGYENYGPVTADKPDSIPPGYLSFATPGSFNLPAAHDYPFPELTVAIPADGDDRMHGTWVLGSGDQKATGELVFERLKPTITAVEFKSNVTDRTDLSRPGCVVLDYSGESWGPGNEMRGNRPGFTVNVYGDDFYWFALDHYRFWMDPESHLDLGGAPGSPIFELDADGNPTRKLIGVSVRVDIWPGSEWGQKSLFVNGQPITFDYYVKPVYPFTLNPVTFQLVDGHYPDKPKAGQPVHLGFRLAKLPDHDAGDVVVDFRFVDSDSFEPVADVKARDASCQPSGAGQMRCSVPGMAIDGMLDLEFVAQMPNKGLRWFASWSSRGEPDADTRVGLVEADDAPQILSAFSMTDQTGELRPQTRDFRYPYPGKGSIDQKREVVLFGRNLPQTFGDPDRIESLDPAISYTPRYGAAYKSRLDMAWQSLVKRTGMTREQLEKDYGVLLLDATVSGRPLPGEKSLRLNGQLATWDLRFGGLNASIEFIRESGDATPNDILETAYAPERFRVRVTTSSPLPVDSIPMELQLRNTVRDVTRREAAGETTQLLGTLTFRATKGTPPNTYVSPFIRLVDKGRPYLSPPPQDGDVVVETHLNGTGVDWLTAGIDPEFVKHKFKMPVLPAAANLPLSVSPAKHRSARDPLQSQDFQFKNALLTAARCADLPVTDWNKLTLDEADNYMNVVVITHGDHIRKTEIKVGDHAAMLLMRDLFVDMLNDVVRDTTDVAGNPLGPQGFLKSMRYQLDNPNLPINRLSVTAPDGSQVEYGSTALFEDTGFLARRFDSTPEAMARWRQTATIEALSKIGSGASEAAQKARAIPDCDAKALLELTGTGFDAVVDRLRPRLMTLEEQSIPRGGKRLYWVRDKVARYWVGHVATILPRVQEQEQVARDDNMRLSIAYAVVSLPVSLFGSPGIALSLVGVDMTMLGTGIADDWGRYYASQAELDFSRNAAPVLGFARNDTAKKKAFSWLRAYEMTVVQGGIGALVAVGTKDQILEALLEEPSVVLKGRAAVKGLREGGLRAAAEADRRQIRLFALRARATELTAGTEALSAAERRAIELVDDELRSAERMFLNDSRTLGVGEETLLPPGFPNEARQVEFVAEAAEAGAAGSSAAARAEGASVRMEHVAVDPNARVVRLERPPVSPDSETVGSELSERFVTARARGLQGRDLDIVVLGEAQPIPFRIGDYVANGSFSAVYGNRLPFAEYDSFVKISFGKTHDAADQFGREVLESIASPNIVLPRETLVVRQGEGILGLPPNIREIKIVENLGQTAEQQLGRLAELDKYQINAIKRALKDLNDAGYVHLDFKNNQFTFIGSGEDMKIGMIDAGGIVRVRGGDPELAKEIQSVVTGPYEEVNQAMIEMGNLSAMPPVRWRPDMRKVLIREKYGDAFEDLERLDVKRIDDLSFKPSFGDQFSPTTVEQFSMASGMPRGN